MKFGAILLAIVVIQVSAFGQGAPTTQPLAPEQKLDQMLKPSSVGEPLRPLAPGSSAPVPDSRTSSAAGAAVAPGAPHLAIMREGTFLVDRMGRISRSADGQGWEFAFEADGRAMKDPPVVILPNLKLMQMEQAMKTSSRDLRFRVTGMVTEYNSRNYILLEKVVVIPESTQQF